MIERSRDDLERARAKWWATVSSGDLDGYVSLFADDAVWVTPELDEIVGRDAIRAWLEPVFAQFDYELTITVADVRVAGDLGIERARFVSRMTPKPPAASWTTADPAQPGAAPVAPPPLPPRGWVPGDDERTSGPPGAAPDEPGAGTGEGPSEEAGAESGPGGFGPGPLEAVPVSVDSEAVDRPAHDRAAAVDPDAVDVGGDNTTDADSSTEAAGPAAGVVEPVGDGDRGEGVRPVEGAESPDEAGDTDETEPVAAPLLIDGGGDHEPHEGRYLMYWRWYDGHGWLVQRYADVTGVG